MVLPNRGDRAAGEYGNVVATDCVTAAIAVTHVSLFITRTDVSN